MTAVRLRTDPLPDYWEINPEFVNRLEEHLPVEVVRRPIIPSVLDLPAQRLYRETKKFNKYITS